MSLYKYAQACNGFELELKEYLTREDIDELRKDCVHLGDSGFVSWMNDHLKDVLAFVEATPAQRKKRKSWADPVLKRRLVLGAIWGVVRARRLLYGIENHRLYPGGSYRDVAASAIEAYVDCYYDTDEIWPFDDPNPFE